MDRESNPEYRWVRSLATTTFYLMIGRKVSRDTG